MLTRNRHALNDYLSEENESGQINQEDSPSTHQATEEGILIAL